MEEPATRRRAFIRPLRWMLATALLVVLATLGYREGFRRGYEPEPLAQVTTSALVVQTYPVADLVTLSFRTSSGDHPVNFDWLIDLIVSTVERESWMENGRGEGEIQPFPTNLSLIISQTPRIHKQISDLLDQLRHPPKEVTAKKAIPGFQTWTARGEKRSYVPHPFSDAMHDGNVAAECFAKTMQNIADVWGPPTFHGRRDDADFPAWSTAEELACWPRGAGVAYVSFEPNKEDLPQLTIGWRPDD